MEKRGATIMEVKDEMPINKYESKILLLLKLKGYYKNIRFRTDLEGNRFLTINYWESVSNDILNYIMENIPNIVIREQSWLSNHGEKIYYDLYKRI
tara:strand:- start:81 stop:368 length:288 start_codon:yes stop_codon:yes gene_type:complete